VAGRARPQRKPTLSSKWRWLSEAVKKLSLM
jgi:hypothetical protein